MTRRPLIVVVDPTRCDAHGVCAELFPEQIARDPWGYPLISGTEVRPEHLEHARRAVDQCPRLALHLLERRR